MISIKEIRRKKEMLVPLFNIRIQWRYLHTDQIYLYLLYFDPQIIYTHMEIFIESNLDSYIENCGTIENYIMFGYKSITSFGDLHFTTVCTVTTSSV